MPKAISWNNLVVLVLAGAALFGIETSVLIANPVLATATRGLCIFIAVGLGVYRKPS